MGLLDPKIIKGQKHILAYITPGEANTLEDLGGEKTITSSGIPAYPPPGEYGGAGYTGGSSSSNNSGGNQGSDQGHSRFESGSGYYGETVTTSPNTGGDGGGDIDSIYTDTSFNVTPEVQEKSIGDRIVDYYKDGGLIGMGFRAIGGMLNSENQYEGITGEDGYGEGDYVSTLDDWSESRGLGDDYSALDAEGQAFIDQEAYNAGWRSPAFQSLYEGGDISNINNLTSSESTAINELIPQASYMVGNTTPVESQVDKWFANNPANTGLNPDYLNTYNTAKEQIASTLGMVDTSNQFGYSASPYGGLTAQNLTTNPFNIPYMQERGLI